MPSSSNRARSSSGSSTPRRPADLVDTIDYPASVTFPAVAAANAFAGVEAYRSIRFEDLPSDLVQQLRSDGTHGDMRTMAEARAVFDHNVPAEAKGSIDGIRAVVDDPSIHWAHRQPHANGGGSTAENGVYAPAELNWQVGDRRMSDAEIAEAEAYTFEVAEQATPGVTGDLADVAGDTLETGAFGGVMGGGLAAVHRLAQAQGFRDAGRHDLAAACEEKIGDDVAKGAMNGVLRGTAVAATQAVLGANPFTAGIGLVAPDAIALLTQKDQLSQEEYERKSVEVVGKGVLATVLVCAGPIGWLGLAGLSVAMAYSKANEQASSSQQMKGA
ncbi:hypothetical protein [Cyanobium sp. Copco_Reservoir_LC18]|uniref:hypothetical protein n=1 Tax=Cyanobium sp. Copco_Reservoir_LC18 TaxID=1328305 RepID=UPI0013576A10|nr:hypothetical protein [Cyanobium sp. Copco_Reservoir_LC18]